MAGLAARDGEGDFGEPFTFAGMAAPVKVCGCRPHEGGTAHTGGRRTQTSKGGNRGRCGEVARQTLWGLTAVVPEREHKFCDMARTLRMGKNTFRRPCNFKELRVVKKAHISTFALCASLQPLYRI